MKESKRIELEKKHINDRHSDLKSITLFAYMFSNLRVKASPNVLYTGTVRTGTVCQSKMTRELARYNTVQYRAT